MRVGAWDVGRREGDKLSLSTTEWNRILGEEMFDLRAEDSGTHRPTFRSLISYFVRTGKDAYATPFETVRKQKAWQTQVNNAFLLGLEWRDARSWEDLRSREKGLQSLQAAAKSGVLVGVVGKPGELDAARARLQQAVRRQEESLAAFKVHPEYRDIERTASELDRRIKAATNENVSDRGLLSVYESALREAEGPAIQDVTRVYEEAGVALPGIVVRRLEEVREFHLHLVTNRREFLRGEASRLAEGIQRREKAIEVLSNDLTSSLSVLSTHGALDSYTAMQRRLADDVARLREIENRIANARAVDTGKSELKVERERLYQKARRDYDDRDKLREKAILLFNGHSEALYQHPGTLLIEVTNSGFRFDVDIERAKSDGVSNMKVFCYDLTLAQFWATQPRRPGFVVHDSLIFDGVDPRQRALALARAAEVSKADGFQYITTINSDQVPQSDFPEGFRFGEHVRLRLSDATPEGCLLGIRF